MSDTPRTDAAQIPFTLADPAKGPAAVGYLVPAETARELERELRDLMVLREDEGSTLWNYAAQLERVVMHQYKTGCKVEGCETCDEVERTIEKILEKRASEAAIREAGRKMLDESIGPNGTWRDLVRLGQSNIPMNEKGRAALAEAQAHFFEVPAGHVVTLRDRCLTPSMCERKGRCLDAPDPAPRKDFHDPYCSIISSKACNCGFLDPLPIHGHSIRSD